MCDHCLHINALTTDGLHGTSPDNEHDLQLLVSFLLPGCCPKCLTDVSGQLIGSVLKGRGFAVRFVTGVLGRRVVPIVRSIGLLDP